MSTIVQRTYRDGMRKALPGMVCDDEAYSIITRQCLTAAGIPFGRVCSASGETGAILGGGLPSSASALPFLGIAAKDVTLNGLPLDPLVDTHGAADTYDVNRNMAILTRGHIWVETDDTVAAGDAVYFDWEEGTLGNSASGQQPTGYVDFTSNPVDAKTITLGGVVTTFKDTVTNATVQSQIKPTLRETVVTLAAFLNASANTTIDDATYYAVTTDDGERLYIVHDTVGTAGNTFGVATNVDGATPSGATLSGGYAGSQAAGAIAFSQQPADNSTITFNGTVVTLHDGTSGTVNRGADLAATVDALVTFVNASGDAQLAKVTLAATGTPHSGVTVTSDAVGSANNAYTLAASASPNAYATITPMSGGRPASTLVANAVWLTGAAAGDLAKLSLAIQR